MNAFGGRGSLSFLETPSFGPIFFGITSMLPIGLWVGRIRITLRTASGATKTSVSRILLDQVSLQVNIPQGLSLPIAYCDCINTLPANHICNRASYNDFWNSSIVEHRLILAPDNVSNLSCRARHIDMVGFVNIRFWGVFPYVFSCNHCELLSRSNRWDTQIASICWSKDYEWNEGEELSCVWWRETKYGML